MKTTLNKKSEAIGKLISISNKYARSYKIGGAQKLSAVLGKSIFKVTKGGGFWNVVALKKASITKLNSLSVKVRTAVKKKK
jgi:hypothetical protein